MCLDSFSLFYAHTHFHLYGHIHYTPFVPIYNSFHFFIISLTRLSIKKIIINIIVNFYYDIIYFIMYFNYGFEFSIF